MSMFKMIIGVFLVITVFMVCGAIESGAVDQSIRLPGANVMMYPNESPMAGYSPATVKTEMIGEMICNKSVVDVRVAMRKLWEDHILYTRNYIISAVADLDEAGTFAQRLLKNEEDIENVVRPLYGDETGNILTILLRNHISIASWIVKAARMGEKDDLSKAKQLLENNAGDIAAFLGGLNLYLSREECGQYAI